jgi:hypothetical protein
VNFSNKSGVKRAAWTSSLILGAAAAVALTKSTVAFAQGPGWTANSTVVNLVVTANGGINVRLSPELTNCVSQSGYGSAYASIYPSHPGLKEMQANLLAAYLTGGKVALYLSDANCTVYEMSLVGP